MIRQTLRRVPGARWLYHNIRVAAKALHRRWEFARPFPRPRYISPTPRTGDATAFNPFLPPTSLTLGEAATSGEAYASVADVIHKLTPIKQHDAGEYMYRFASAKFQGYWRYADILTVLWAAAKLVQPTSYLEIGVWRGRSAAIVGSVRPECAIYGFDLWLPDYAGAEAVGPESVRNELRSLDHTGEVTLITGDSRTTLPAFLAEHPDVYFDVMAIDGVKSVVGCASDFAAALPRLRVGGIVVFDDIPLFPTLDRVWDRLIRRDPRYATWEFSHGRFGIAAAIRLYE